MAITIYLATTAEEFHSCKSPPEPMAWMACHFSAYGDGLTNMPTALPANSMLILNDRIPYHRHNIEKICVQLDSAVKTLHAEKVLLDFQQTKSRETSELIQTLIATLPCPVGVTPAFAEETATPIFLPPPKINQPLKDYFSSWSGREIWMEAALSRASFTLTEKGCTMENQLPTQETGTVQECKDLHCHYCVHTQEEKVIFSLWRTKNDFNALMEEAQSLNINTAVGLYQELREI